MDRMREQWEHWVFRSGKETRLCDPASRRELEAGRRLIIELNKEKREWLKEKEAWQLCVVSVDLASMEYQKRFEEHKDLIVENERRKDLEAMWHQERARYKATEVQMKKDRASWLRIKGKYSRLVKENEELKEREAIFVKAKASYERRILALEELANSKQSQKEEMLTSTTSNPTMDIK